MKKQYGPSPKSRRRKERRRFPRHPWTLPTRVKTFRQEVSEGSLLNVGRGGGLLTTRASLSVGDLLQLRIPFGREEHPRSTLLPGKVVWSVSEGRGKDRFGVLFLESQGDHFERLRRYQEFIHSKGVAKTLGVRFIDLNPSMVEKRALNYVNRDLAFSLNCMPVKLRGERLMVAMVDPGDSKALERLQFFSQCKVVPLVATPTAIRSTLVQCWGTRYVPAEADGLHEPEIGQIRRNRRPRILAIVSSTSNLSGPGLAANLTALLNSDEERACQIDLQSAGAFSLDRVLETRDENCEWIVLTIPMEKSGFAMDWAIHSDETFLVVSPSHSVKGCLYIESLFDRFVEIQKDDRAAFRRGMVRRRFLELSVICAEISHIREGFRIFKQIEARVHQALDMKEPGFDTRLSYVGGILDDERNIRKSEKMGVPITILKPHSPASKCIIHIAHSLVKPARERDPRIIVNRSLASRIFG